MLSLLQITTSSFYEEQSEGQRLTSVPVEELDSDISGALLVADGNALDGDILEFGLDGDGQAEEDRTDQETLHDLKEKCFGYFEGKKRETGEGLLASATCCFIKRTGRIFPGRDAAVPIG